MTFEQWLARPRRDEMVMPDVEAHTLFGWWKILSFQVEFEDAGERADTYGVNPLGHMVIDRDRMMSILTSRERPNTDPTALFETMIAYSGSCRVEDGDKLIIKVDTAWHPAWIGTEQVRFFKVDSARREYNVWRPRHRLRGGERNAAERPESASQNSFLIPTFTPCG